jgi:2,3-bisphosphoglycerate-dependent phosphoglycerate mutase
MRRRVLLVRHCQSQANAEGRIEGKGDSALSEEGERQAERVAAFIAAQGLSEVTLIASSQARAIATAGAIGRACGWSHVSDHRIREGELGWMEDLPYTEVGRHMREKQATVLDAHVHGGESLDTVGERFWEALGEALETSDGVLVLVSHGYAIQALLRRLTSETLPPSFIGNGDVVELWLEAGALAEPPKHYPLNAAHSAA